MGTKIWSDEAEAELVSLYLEEDYTLDDLAEHFNKSIKSIRSKLVSLKQYKKPNNNIKRNDTVKEMLRKIETMLEIQIDGFNLNKKSNLNILVIALEEKIGYTK